MRLKYSRKFAALTPARIALPSLLASCFVAAAFQSAAHATTYNWTNDTNDTDIIGNDTFDTSSPNWSTATSVHTNWANSNTNIAVFNDPPSPTAVKVASGTIIAAGLTFNASGWSLSAPSSTGSAFSANSSTAPFTITLAAAGVTASSNVALGAGITHGLLVTGAGTFTTTNVGSVNTFTGTITVTGGATLSTGSATDNAVLGYGTAPGRNTVLLDNGTLAAAASINLARTIFLGPSDGSPGGGSVAETTSGATLTLSSYIFNSNANDSLTVSTANAGTVMLTSASNGYTGATNILAGTLELAKGANISTSSEINVAAKATFDVHAVTGYTVAIPPPGQSQPQYQILTGSGGTVIGDTALSGDATFLANLDATTATLNFMGTLDLAAMPTLTLSGPADGNDNYTLATFSGTETGTFGATNLAAAAPGYTIDYGIIFPHAITLIAPDLAGDPAPEPASLALMSLGAAAFLVRRRHPRRI